jgi:hypothetical protein
MGRGQHMNTLVFHANGIGDDLINRAPLAMIAKACEGKATLVTSSRPRGHFLLDDLPFERIVRTPVEDGHFDVDAIAPQLPESLDAFVSMAPYFSDDLSALRKACGALNSVGFGEEFDVRVDMLAPKHAVELAFDVARAAGTPVCPTAIRPGLSFERNTIVKVEAFIGHIRRTRAPKMLCVHSETFHTKRLDPSVIREVICRFLREHDDFTAIVLDVARFENICPCHAHRVISANGMSLQFAIALLGQSDLFFGIDSCMLHAADYQGVPGVIAFGPATSSSKFGYFWSSAEVMSFSDPLAPGLAATAVAAMHDVAAGRSSF